MWITPTRQGNSSCTPTAIMLTNYRFVLTQPSLECSRSGHSLADMIEERGRFDDRVVISTCISILKALSETMVEGRGTFPVNLTPASIIFNQNDEIEFAEVDPEITLVSISEVDGNKLTISGSPAYMSPERLTGLSEGSRFGIYTFGTIMYAMLTGHPPYNEGSARDTIDAVKRGPPPRLVQLNPATDSRLIGICEKCMNRWVSCRYASLFDVLSDLERLQAKRSSKGTSGIRDWFCSMLSACL
jgi:serine/threonine-protein kinase